MPRIRGIKDTGKALWQALTGRAYSSTEKASVQDKTRDMVDRWGKKETASRLGVSVRTIERRLKGEQKVSKRNAEKLDKQHRAAKMTPGRTGNLRGSGSSAQGGTGGLYIYGRIKVSQDIRERGIHPGEKVSPAALDNIIAAMVDGGPDAAQAELNAALQSYVNDMEVLEIYEIDW